MNTMIDCSGITERAQLHSLLASKLRFPEWYGQNLDALFDCLTELTDPLELTLKNWQLAQNALGDYGIAARQTFEDAAQENPDFTVTFS